MVVVVVVTTVVRVAGAKESWPSEVLDVDPLGLEPRMPSKSRFRGFLTVVVRERYDRPSRADDGIGDASRPRDRGCPSSISAQSAGVHGVS